MTELETLVVRLTADTNQYVQQIEQAGKKTQDAVGPTGGLGLGVMQARRGLHILGMAAGEAGMQMSHMGVMGVYGVSILKDQIGAAIVQFGVLKTVAGGAVVGGVAVGAALALRHISQLHDEAKKMGEAVGGAFVKMSEGAETFSSAMVKMRHEVLSGAIKEAVTQFASGPTTFESIATGGMLGGMNVTQQERFLSMIGSGATQENFTKAMERAVKNSVEAQRIFRELMARPEMQQVSAQLGAAAASAQLEGLDRQLELRERSVGLSHDEVALQKVLMELQRNAAGMSADEQEAARAKIRALQIKAVVVAYGELKQKLDEERETVGMNATQIAIYNLAKKGVSPERLKELSSQAELNENLKKGADLLRSMTETNRNFGLSAAEAAARTLDQAAAQGDLKAALIASGLRLKDDERSRNAVRQSAEQLSDQADRFGMAADAADRFSRVQQVARERGISLAHAYEKIKVELGQLEQQQNRVAGQRVFEETRTPVERFTERVRELNRLLLANSLPGGVETYGRALQAAAHGLSAPPPGSTAGALRGSSGALATQTSQLQSQQSSQISLLGDIRGLLQEINARQAATGGADL